MLQRVLLCLLLLSPLMAEARNAPENLADSVEQLSPAVVNISTTKEISPRKNPFEQFGKALPEGHPFGQFEDFFERFIGPRGHKDGGSNKQKANSLGSGFVIDPAGYIVTNNHVIDGADEITVTLGTDEDYVAELVGRDAKTDLALLKVDADKPLPYVQFGDSDASRVGDWVIVIGNPFGFGGSVTTGIISAKTRDINAGPFDDFIQTDAAINRGNSGGPMFNLAGEVIGINTAIYSPGGGNVGIGFAVPSALAQPIIEQLKETGSIERGWLGVKIQTVTDEIADSLGLDAAKGALVADVVADSPADKGGVEVGDVVLSFDGKPVPEMKKLPRIVAETVVGSDVSMVVWRNGNEKRLSIEVDRLDESDELVANNESHGAETQETILGLALTKLTDALRAEYGVTDSQSGLLVLAVSSDSAAAEQGVGVGDVVVEVNQKKAKRLRDVEKAIDDAEDRGRTSVLLLVSRGGESRFVALPIAE